MTTNTSPTAHDTDTRTGAHALPRTGVVGLGMIGGGIAVSMARSGTPAVAVHDVRPDAAEGLVGVPPVLDSPADVAAECDVVLLAVVTADQARAALEGPGGLLGAARPGLVVVLLSTVSLAEVRDLSALCQLHDVVLLDAGVTGGTRAAENGLTTMVGGPEGAVDAVLPVLESFSRSVVRCGPLGTGMSAKLARNLVTYGQWAVVREATALAAAAGVSAATLLEVLSSTDGGVEPLLHLQLLAAGHQVPAERVASAVGLSEKDLAAAQALGAELGLEVPLADLVRPRMGKVYGGELDEPLPTEERARGLAMMDRTYGPGYSEQVSERSLGVPSVRATVDHLFAQVWARPFLSLRDRRLLTLGVTATVGRQDLIETQLTGAQANAEFTDDQLREIALHLHHYAGWPQGTNLLAVTEKLIAAAAVQTAD